MAFFDRFSSSSQELLHVDDHQSVVSSSFSWVSFCEKISLFLLIALLLFSLSSFGSLIEERDFAAHEYFQLLEEKKTEQHSLESLRLLSSRQSGMLEDQALFSQVLPDRPLAPQIVKQLEIFFEKVRGTSFAISPELISWRTLSQQEISSDIFQNLGITEFSFRFEGSYEALLEFVTLMRSSKRIMDLRSFRNLSFQEDGIIAVDLSLWTYHVLSSSTVH